MTLREIIDWTMNTNIFIVVGVYGIVGIIIAIFIFLAFFIMG